MRACGVLLACLMHIALGDDLLANWMGRLPVTGLTLSEITIPGSHDTLTYDLSKTVSQGAIDGQDTLSKILHTISPVAPGGWIRDVSQTQVLNITQQLDNGIRYIDLRMMRESNLKKWYSLHFVQSNNIIEYYLADIKQWLLEHPTEVVLIQCSKHGQNELIGEEAYPGVSIVDRFQFWMQIETMFTGMLLDNRVSSLTKTTIGELVKRNHRAIFLMGDYDNFTYKSPFALDSRVMVQGDFEGNARNPEAFFADSIEKFSVMGEWNAKLRKEGKYSMYTMAMAESGTQLEELAMIHFLGLFGPKAHLAKCAADFKIEGNTFCPKDLLQTSQLQAYYNQVVLENAYLNGWDLPNAIIVDALDVDGTIRTSSDHLTTPVTEATARYAYVDTILAVNLRVSCARFGGAACDSLAAEIELRRSANPLFQVEQPESGRRGPGYPAPIGTEPIMTME